VIAPIGVQLSGRLRGAGSRRARGPRAATKWWEEIGMRPERGRARGVRGVRATDAGTWNHGGGREAIQA